jgi:branched-chain amino acid transport system substrate-binding protein
MMKRYSPDTVTTGYAVVGYQGLFGLVRAVKNLAGEVRVTSAGLPVKGAQQSLLSQR